MNTSKVVIISTGGTIAMRYDPVQKGVFLQLQDKN